MQPKLNLSAIPTDAAAIYLRFDNPTLPNSRDLDTWRVVPVVYRKEWVYPRTNMGNDRPIFKTVRVSEHRWPLHKSTFMCSNGTDDMWPQRPEPTSRVDLIRLELLTPAHWYQPAAEGPCLEMRPEDLAKAYSDYLDGAPNDGLPADYLDFWLQGDSEDAP